MGPASLKRGLSLRKILPRQRVANSHSALFCPDWRLLTQGDHTTPLFPMFSWSSRQNSRTSEATRATRPGPGTPILHTAVCQPAAMQRPSHRKHTHPRAHHGCHVRSFPPLVGIAEDARAHRAYSQAHASYASSEARACAKSQHATFSNPSLPVSPSAQVPFLQSDTINSLQVVPLFECEQ